jgi:peptidoglycan/xylan/chitin deacetylase (PgdA/CDA1 family)
MSRASRAQFRTPHGRPPLALPEGDRLAVHLVVNVEDWRYDVRLPRQVLTAPGGFQPLPDVPNFAWYSYGMRVGIWRLLELIERYTPHVTLSLNASVCDAYPSIVAATERAGWEIMAHGYYQQAMPTVDDERATIRDALARIERETGKRPRGWLGPGLVESFVTADLLADHGLLYCCDWGPADDLPFELEVARGTLIAVPYPVDMNDIVVFGLEQRPDDALLLRGKRHFDVLYRESANEPRIMAIALHPWISGVPHRIDYLDELLRYITGHAGVRFMSGGEIAEWFRSSRGAAAR